jgi:O-methyltransferase
MKTMNMTPAKRLIKASFTLIGLNISRMPRGSSSTQHFDQLYRKYKDNTMLGRKEYVTNLALTATVTTPGCVIECGVWKGGSSAGMAEVLGSDREYFLFDSFQGHVDPQPIDGPAAFAWQDDKNGPWYFNNALVGTEEADAAMKKSGAKNYRLVKGWFEDTLANFTPPSPIAVLRIDCDWYASTMTCLHALFPHVAEDGILIADGYPDWDGYARAIHEYLAGYEGVARIKQFDAGLYYVVKGARQWEYADFNRPDP